MTAPRKDGHALSCAYHVDHDDCTCGLYANPDNGGICDLAHNAATARMTSQSPEPIPGWAKERAKQVLDPADPRGIGDGYRCLSSWVQDAVAAYIASVEEEPVDPVEYEASLIWDQWLASSASAREMVTKALRRGIELGRASK